MENAVSVSVIVPAYNAEKVVKNCVESILRQTLKNIEIIAVDDGSKDHTRSVLRELAQKDERITLIEKDKNEGLSAARNSALKVAKGEYVGFVDADDWVEENTFENMYTKGQGVDLVVAGYLHDTMDENRTVVNISRNVSAEPGYWTKKSEVVSKAADIDTAKMFAYTWNKLYKRDLILESHLEFSKQVLIEDFIFNTLFWDKISTLSVIEDMGYHYVKASKDALTQKFLPDFLDIMNLRFEYIRNLLKKNNVYEGKAKEQLANIYIKHAIAGVVRNCSPMGHYSFREQYARTKTMLKYSQAKEACQNAKGNSKQEKVCNLVFKTRLTLLVFLLGKAIYMMQTKSKTAFDKLK